MSQPWRSWKLKERTDIWTTKFDLPPSQPDRWTTCQYKNSLADLTLHD